MSRDLIDVQLGAAIQRRRVEMALSVSALAERLSQPFVWVQAVEGGETRLRTSQLTAVCGALDMTLQDLFTRAQETASREQPVSA